MNTKEKIIDEALTLFSQRGYSGVSVKEIAGAVGIKDSSIYKHFSSKKDIFDTILTKMTGLMDNLADSLHIADAYKGDASPYFSSLTVDELVELSKKIFLFYLKDRFAARFRRMLTIEQYSNSEISSLYKKIFTSDSIDYQSVVFRQLIDCGAFNEADPEILAMSFYSPIFLLICRCDGDADREEEALALIERHVREFAKTYSKQNGGV